MKKSDRQNIFEKYAGKCAYCGCELQKGWHVDHLEPIRRHRKYEYGYWKEIATGKRMSTKEMNAIPESIPFNETFKWVPDRWVTSGCENPENDCMENYNPSCASCNINKHGDTIEGFRTSIAGFMKHLNEISTQYKIAKRYGLIQETGIEVKFYFETMQVK
jgi:hypothetical protein